ncbi:IS5 family transposase [Mycolicibacterium sp. ND9-15]|uniref:IS5 family transposase n=1 Tax=Mycolicibacterium sp. ND9-15 TaxID=3042320 RepID=UPI002DD81F45|nr:IS5 family transposase [Mycolicibacterium sp. ND9-15]WSE58313.1 IS5 family transposase [Mycolicibacterium sp. ND9-15]
MSRFELLSDAQWALIEDLLPVRTGKRGRPFQNARSMVEGIIYRYRCGIAWRDVPEAFGPWQSIWTWHRRMSADGTWDSVLARLLAAAEEAGIIDWAVAVDSTIARAHQHATNVTRHTQGAGSNYTNPGVEPADHGIGRSRGGLTSKIHHLVDGRGRPMVVLVGPGQAHDGPVFEHLLAHLKVDRRRGGRARTRPDRVRGDRAYSSRVTRTRLRRRRIGAVIPEPSDQIAHRKRRGSRGGRPPAFDAEDYKGRNVVERNFNVVKQWRGLATRYDKLAIVYRGAAVLRAITLWLPHLSDTP